MERSFCGSRRLFPPSMHWRVAFHSQLQAQPSGVPMSPSSGCVQPSPSQKDPAGSSRTGPGNSREGRKAILPARNSLLMGRRGSSTPAAPVCPLPCPAGDTELCRQSWTVHSGWEALAIPSLVHVMLEGGGMRGAGREWRSWEGMEELGESSYSPAALLIAALCAAGACLCR